MYKFEPNLKLFIMLKIRSEQFVLVHQLNNFAKSLSNISRVFNLNHLLKNKRIDYSKIFIFIVQNITLNT